MEENRVRQLVSLGSHNRTWAVKSIIIPTVVSLTDDTLVPFNFASTIGQTKELGKENTKIYLPKEHNKNDKGSRSALARMFVMACAQSGSEVFMKGWENDRQLIRFCCVRGRTYKKRQKPLAQNNANKTKKTYNSTTLKPTEGTETCKFGFSVHWDNSAKRWYVQMCGFGCGRHNGHCHKEPEEIRHSTKAIGEEELEVANDACNANVPPDALRALILKRTGICLNDSQLKNIRKIAPGLLMNARLTQEINMSQAAAEEEDEDEPLSLEDDNESGQPGVSGMKRLCPGSTAYSAFHPMFQDITRMAVSDEQWEYLRKSFLAVRENVLRMGMKRQNGIVFFPETDVARKPKRLRPATSPSKYKK